MLPPLLLLAGLAAAQPSGGAVSPAAAAHYRAHCLSLVPKTIRLYHLDPARVDGDAICGRLVERLETGMLPSDFADAYLGEMNAILYDFATPGKQHDRTARYRLPFRPWIPRLLSQTSGGATHKTLDQYHAFDFVMPVGTWVQAARAGTVAYVADGTPPGVPWEEDAGNAVNILHDDGTWANYVHLQAGIPVKVGERVKRGQPIARSGNTGFSRTPHLHFNVQRMDHGGEIHSVPIVFGQPGKLGRRLEAGHHQGTVPKSRRELRVFVDGRRSIPDEPIAIDYGARPEMRVELVNPAGGVVDVTRDPRMRYETMTVWNVHSPAIGEVVIEALPESDAKILKQELSSISQSEGLLFVYHGVPWDGDFGFARVPFHVRAATP